MQPKLSRIIRPAEISQYVGLKRTQIDVMMKAGEFPKPISISDSGRAVAWLEIDLIAWQASRIAKRDNAEAISDAVR